MSDLNCLPKLLRSLRDQKPLLLDTFTRADATSVGNAESGQAWTVVDAGGDAGILNNMFTDRSSTAGVYPLIIANAGVVNQKVRAVIGSLGEVSESTYLGVYARARLNPTLEGFVVESFLDEGQLRLGEITSAVQTTLETVNVSWQVGDVVEVFARGALIEVFVNGELKIAEVSTLHGSNSLAGLYAGSEGTGDKPAWDSIAVRRG